MINLKYILILFLATRILLAQNYPSTVHLDSIQIEVYQSPNSIPNYLESTINEQGLIVTRISDDIVFGTTGERLGLNYSSDQPWNNNETLIKLAGYPAAILDAETYELLYWANIPSVARWANTHPDIMYGTEGNKIVSYDVTTDIRTPMHVFSEFSQISFGYGEGNQDTHDRYIGLIGLNSGQNETLIVYDMWNDTYNTLLTLAGDLDVFTVSPLGNFAIVEWRPDGSGATQGIKRYNIDLDPDSETHLYNYTAHSDIGQLLNGDEVIVQYGNEPQWDNDYYLHMINITTGENTDLFHWSQALHGNSGIWGGHISLRSNRLGIAFISEECCRDHGTLPQEMFALHLDGSNLIERFGKHHTNIRMRLDNGTLDAQRNYNHSSRLVPNRTGNKVMTVSNYFDASTQLLDSGFTFIFEVEQGTLGTIDYVQQDTRTDNVKCYNMLGQLILTTDSMESMLIYIKEIPQGIYVLYTTYINGSREVKKIHN